MGFSNYVVPRNHPDRRLDFKAIHLSQCLAKNGQAAKNNLVGTTSDQICSYNRTISGADKLIVSPDYHEAIILRRHIRQTGQMSQERLKNRIFSKKRGNVPKVSSKAWLSRSNLRDGVPCP
jgi:hypothetical protein